MFHLIDFDSNLFDVNLIYCCSFWFKFDWFQFILMPWWDIRFLLHQDVCKEWPEPETPSLVSKKHRCSRGTWVPPSRSWPTVLHQAHNHEGTVYREQGRFFLIIIVFIAYMFGEFWFWGIAIYPSLTKMIYLFIWIWILKYLNKNGAKKDRRNISRVVGLNSG